MPEYKLGRLPPLEKDMRRRLFLRSFLREITIPPSTAWRDKAQKSLSAMLGNDVVGDCVIAGIMHAIGIWTANGATEEVFTTQQATELYFKLTGGVDSGLMLQTALKYAQQVGIYGHKIGPYLAIDPHNKAELQAAISNFGCAYLACSLPARWQRDLSIWDANAGYTIGGHCITGVDYDQLIIDTSTWGQLANMTYAGCSQYVDEAYVILSPDWYKSGKSPTGLDVDGLMKALQEVTGQPIPGPTPPSPPPAPPSPPTPPAPSPCPWRAEDVERYAHAITRGVASGLRSIN